MSWREPGEAYFLPDLDDPPEVRRSFGYEHMVLTRRARQLLKAQGVTDEQELYTRSQRMYERWYQDVIPFREVCRRRSIRAEAEAENRWRSGEGEEGLSLTQPELRYLLERLDGVNDPVGQAVAAKIGAILERRDQNQKFLPELAR